MIIKSNKKRHMKKGWKIFLFIAVIGIVVGLGTVYYVFNKPHRNVEGEKPAFTMEAKTLFEEYNMDEDAGNLKFGNQVLQVTGEIVEITSDNSEVSIILSDDMEGINCSLDSMTIVQHKTEVDALQVGNEITLKGKCDGFDMIMGVVLTRCYIISD